MIAELYSSSSKDNLSFKACIKTLNSMPEVTIHTLPLEQTACNSLKTQTIILYGMIIIETSYTHTHTHTHAQSKRILRHLTGKEYQEVLGMIEDGIRSTDLAVYAERKDYFIELVADKSFDWFSEPHKKVLRSTMMVACDLSAITKPWKIHKRVRTMLIDIAIYTKLHYCYSSAFNI